MAVTREQLLANPKSGARPLSRGEAAERACNAELAPQWLLATSPFGRRCQVQVSEAEVLDDIAPGRVAHSEPHPQAEAEAQAV